MTSRHNLCLNSLLTRCYRRRCFARHDPIRPKSKTKSISVRLCRGFPVSYTLIGAMTMITRQELLVMLAILAVGITVILLILSAG